MNKRTIILFLHFIFFQCVVWAQTGKSSVEIFKLDTSNLSFIDYSKIEIKKDNGIKIPIPPEFHPRLYFTPKDIFSLKSKINNSLFFNAWSKILNASKFSTEASLLSSLDNNENRKDQIRNAIEAKAFIAALDNDEQLARQSIALLINFYSSLNINLKKADVTREIGRYIVTGSMVYDWCYKYLTAKEKKLLISCMEQLGMHMEAKWPKLIQGSIVGHGAEAELSRDLLSFGVATYDEKPIVYNLVANKIIKEFIPTRKYFYPASYHHQGSSYGPYRYGWDLYATLIFDKMGYPKIFGEDQAKPPYRWLYARRGDGQFLRSGDDFNELFIPFGNYWSNSGNADLLAGSYFKNPILVNEGFKERQIGSGSDYIFDFLFLDFNFPLDKNKTSLPLTQYFKEPLGAMIARTGWNDGLESEAVVADMKIGVRSFNNHEHLDAGSFQLYYKGPLAIQSGIYQGEKGGYGGSHFKNYSQRSIAHNTMLVYDPNEKFVWHNDNVINDGGQQFPNNGKEPSNFSELMGNEYKIGNVISHQIGIDTIKPEFSYLKGDLKDAYSSKVKGFKRSFVFLNLKNKEVPAVLIVYDQITSSSKDFKKYWLLHSTEEPIFNKNETIIKRSEKGYQGKLINTSLLPTTDNIIINKVGGEGNEFNVFGKNFPQVPYNNGKNSYDSAVWRLEISPQKPALKNQFLNVMQVMDVDNNNQLSVKKIETKEFVGTSIDDRIVLFSKSGELISKDFSLKLSNEKSKFKILITDLKPGLWTVKNSANQVIAKLEASFEGNCIYLDVVKGNYFITKE